MSIRSPFQPIINSEQSKDSTLVIENIRPTTINESILISSFDSSKTIDLPNLEDTELYSEEVPVESEEQAAPALPSFPRQPRYPSISLTVEGETKQGTDKTVTSITQAINNSYITQKTEPYLNKIGMPDQAVQVNFNKEFYGSKRLLWDYDHPTLDIIGNVQVSNAIFATDFSTYSGNSITIDTGFSTEFTANAISFPEYTLPYSNSAFGQVFMTDGTGNVFWASPESFYQQTTTLTGASGTVTHDCNLGSIFIHNNIAGDFIPDFINLNLPSQKSLNILLKLNQGATAYEVPYVKISSTTETVRWVNNDFPFGTPAKTDMISFTIINMTTSYLVFGQMISFG